MQVVLDGSCVDSARRFRSGDGSTRLHNAKSTCHKSQVGQRGIARRIQASDVIVAVGGCKIQGHGTHQIDGELGASFGIGSLCLCNEFFARGIQKCRQTAVPFGILRGLL